MSNKDNGQSSDPEKNAQVRRENADKIPELKVLERGSRALNAASSLCSIVAIIAFIAMVLVTCADIVGGSFFHFSFPGFTDILGFSQLVAISFAMGMTYLSGHHIKVEIILKRLPVRAQAIVQTLTNLLGFFLFVLIIWQLFLLGKTYQDSREVLDGTTVYVYPFVYAMTVAFVPACLAVFFDLIKSFRRSFISHAASPLENIK